MADKVRPVHSWCAKCKQHGLLFPLHDDKGGPMLCLVCKGAWHAEYGKRRNRGRVAIRAMKAFLDTGAPPHHLDSLKIVALADGIHAHLEIDPLGYLHGVVQSLDEIIELTSELLNETISLTHPDKHPPERKEQATRVTQKLADLRPFVFPARPPKPPPAPYEPAPPRDASVNVSSAHLKEPSRPAYPCPQCKATTPYFYCNACKAEHDKRRKEKCEADRARQRGQYARRKARKARRAPPKQCPCGATIVGKRKDARYCSHACRQKHHHGTKSVTTTVDKLSKRTSDCLGGCDA